MKKSRKLMFGGKKSISKSLTLKPFQFRIFKKLKDEYNFPSSSALFQFMIGFMDAVLEDEKALIEKKKLLELMRK